MYQLMNLLINFNNEEKDGLFYVPTSDALLEIFFPVNFEVMQQTKF